jgi:hypothetical protein
LYTRPALYHWSHFPAFVSFSFSFSFFWIGSCDFVQDWSWTTIVLSVLSVKLGIQMWSTTPNLFIEMRSC